MTAGTLPSIQMNRWAGTSSPTIALLGNGRVLAVADDAMTADVWNPGTATWKATDGLGKQRTQFAMVTLQDGRALVAGGLNADFLSFSSAYVYDRAAGGWTKVGLMTSARALPAAAVLADGRVLVAGGYYGQPELGRAGPDPGIALAAFDTASPPTTAGPTPDDVSPPRMGNALATAELFDPSTGTWSETGHLRYARYGAQAVTLADGRVLIVGSSPGPDIVGVEVNSRAYTTAELYDPQTGKFTLTGPLPPIDPKGLAGQGAPAWAVSEVTRDPSPTPYAIGALVPLDDGGAVLIGSTYWWKHEADFTRSFRYDAARGTWSEIGQTWMSIGSNEPPYSQWTSSVPNLDGAAAARLPDGRILAAWGGHTRVYNPRQGSWVSAPAMPDDRSHAAAAVLADGSILLVGGDKHRRSAIRFVPRQ